VLVDPGPRVSLAELDQFLGEFAGEEHVAQKLAVHRVGTAVEDLSQQPQIPRSGFPARARRRRHDCPRRRASLLGGALASLSNPRR